MASKPRVTRPTARLMATPCSAGDRAGSHASSSSAGNMPTRPRRSRTARLRAPISRAWYQAWRVAEKRVWRKFWAAGGQGRCSRNAKILRN
jgi:hypothetical protein